FAPAAHSRELAMPRRRPPHHIGADRLTNRLMAETDNEHRDGGSSRSDQFQADTRLVGSARPRREHDRIGRGCDHLCCADFVVTVHDNVGAQLAEVMNKVEREAVVVVDQDDRCIHVTLASRFGLPAFWQKTSSSLGWETLCFRRLKTPQIPPPGGGMS